MFVRLALEDERETLVELARAGVAESLPDRVFNADKVRCAFDGYLRDCESTFFFVEQDRQVVGFLQARIGEFDFTDGLYTVQKTLYVTPAKRGTRAAALLMKRFIAWSRDTIKALEAWGGVDNEFEIERTARFLEAFGFRKVGYSLVLDLTNGKERHGPERGQPGAQRGSGPAGENPRRDVVDRLDVRQPVQR